MDTVTELPTNRVLEKRIQALTDVVSQLLSMLHVKDVFSWDDLDEFVQGTPGASRPFEFKEDMPWDGDFFPRNNVDSPSVEHRLRGQALVYKECPAERREIFAALERRYAPGSDYAKAWRRAAEAWQAVIESRKGA